MNQLKYSLMLGLAAPLMALAAMGCSSSDSGTPATGGSGGSAGSTGTGGSSGTGGAGGGPAAGSYAIIDDFETSDATTTHLADPFVGAWYVYSEFDATDPTKNPKLSFEATDPHPGAKGMSSKALHVTGPVYAAYSGFGTDLAQAKLFDARAYTGITFWAKKGSATAAGSVIVRVGNPVTDPRGLDGTTPICDPTAPTGMMRCNDDFSSSKTTGFLLTTEWAQYTIAFSDMVQAGWGYAEPSGKLDPSKIYSVKFAPAPGAAVDLWIDDVAMYTK